uniref:Putative RNA polymerase sigma factor n=1 Tax=uncultured bacterium NM_1663 TaxID=1630017 RepID=A0A0E3JNQ5_9BACT|nr:putative RNA polymerase sigma factor [uncultured bacterium NM_1663]
MEQSDYGGRWGADTSSKGQSTGARFRRGIPPLRRPSSVRPGDVRQHSHAVLDRIETSVGENPDVTELVRRAQAGEEIAFAELYVRFFDRVYRYLLIALKDPEEAQEVAQDVFVRALSRLARYEPARGDFRDWLFSMVRSLAIDHLRKAGRVTPVDPSDLPSHAVPVAVRATALLEHLDPNSGVRAMIEALPDAQRRVLALRFVFDLSTVEIGDVLGSNPDAVRQLQHRALKGLAARISVHAA